MKRSVIIVVLIILISSISLAELQSGRLFINDVLIPLTKGINFEDLEKAFEKKSISYVYANGQRIAKIEHNDNGDEIFYFHNDHLGSPRVITDSNGGVVEKIDYLPFGESFEMSEMQSISEHAQKSKIFDKKEKIGYNSKELDFDTQLHYYGARYYNALVGRFITADSVKGNIEDPQSLNLYVYTRNNPMKYIDPSGNQWWKHNWLTKKADERSEYWAREYVKAESIAGKSWAGFWGSVTTLARSDTIEKTADVLLDTFSDIKVAITGKDIEGEKYGVLGRTAAIGTIAVPGMSIGKAKQLLKLLGNKLDILQYAIKSGQVSEKTIRSTFKIQEEAAEIRAKLSITYRKLDVPFLGIEKTKTLEEMKEVVAQQETAREIIETIAKQRGEAKKVIADIAPTYKGMKEAPLIGRY